MKKQAIKKYQSGGKTNTPKENPAEPWRGNKSKFDSPRDSVSAARELSYKFRKAALLEEKGKATPAQIDSAYNVYKKAADAYGLGKENKGFSQKHKEKIFARALHHPIGMLQDETESPSSFPDKYKTGGTIKKQTMKNKPAPKKKMSAKEMEAMKKAKTPMMKYGGKMGKKSC